MRLLDRFRDGIRHHSDDQSESHRQDPIRLATAAILLDIAYADGAITLARDGDLLGYLKRAFSLGDDMARDLVHAAEDIRSKTIDHYSLTSVIRKNSSLAERIEIVKTMWRMVYADGRLTDYEGYLVRKLADLLGLEHRVMIDAKLAVFQEMGRATD
jgi:uncharacterized tellurite resistance protein B-like protein